MKPKTPTTPSSPKPALSCRIALRLRPATRLALERIAETRDVKTSAIVRKSIEDLVKSEGKRK